MNTHRRELTAKAQYLCFWLLCFRPVLAVVPGPCRHSVTLDHLLSLNRLIDNQLDHGCFIIYPFTECLNLSKVCCIKAAVPQILELLSTKFHYVRSSDNRRYVNTLETLIYHLYSQGCIPAINEELEMEGFFKLTLSYLHVPPRHIVEHPSKQSWSEDKGEANDEAVEESPVRFMRTEKSSPKEALKKARAVLQMFMSLMTESSSPVDWDCQAQYAAEEDPMSTPGTRSGTRGTTEPLVLS